MAEFAAESQKAGIKFFETAFHKIDGAGSYRKL
jgi:hypothetical protein